MSACRRVSADEALSAEQETVLGAVEAAVASQGAAAVDRILTPVHHQNLPPGCPSWAHRLRDCEVPPPLSQVDCSKWLNVGVARFIDASIYRNTFPAIRIAILFFTIAIFFFFPHNDFHLGRKDA